MTAPYLYEDAAYRFGAPVGSYWESTAIGRNCAPVTDDLETDVAIIGGGYTGLSAALHLARDHRIKSLVLEAGQPGWGASGRNGGFCCMGGAAASDAALTRRFGTDAVTEWTRTKADAVYAVAELLDRHDIDAEVQPGGEICLAHSKRAYVEQQLQARHLERLLRVPVELYDKAALADHGLGMQGAHGAMHLPIGFGLNPLKYSYGLLRAATLEGADIRGNSPVTEILPGAPGGGFRLRVGAHWVRAQQVILATNGYSAETLPRWMRGRYLPVLSTIMVTRPLSDAELAAQGWGSTVPSYDSRKLLHYFRLLPDNRLLFGMRGETRITPQATARTAHQMRAEFAALFPAWAGVETAYQWRGFVCVTRPQTPFMGPLSGWRGAWAGFGWHGNGVAAGTQAGRMLAQLVAGHPIAETVPAIARTAPAPFPFPAWRRGYLPFGFAWKRWQDWR